MVETTLSSEEWKDLILLVSGGIVLAFSATAFRFLVPRLDVPLGFYLFEYTLAFLFLGVLVLLLFNSNTQVGRIGLFLFVLALVAGLLIPPAVDVTTIISNVLYFVLVLTGGMIHYRFNDPSNTLLIFFAAAFALQFYSFAVGFVWLAFEETGTRALLAGIPIVSLMAWGFRGVLGHELEKVHDQSTLATLLGKVL